jgi:hypothetical protein
MKILNLPFNKKPFFAILLFIIIIITLFILGEQNRNWSQYADQDLTLAYNALLINTGLRQEYYDHPGFFTIRFLAIFINLKYLFGYSEIRTLTDLNLYPSMFLGFEDIVSTGHFVSFFCAGILITSLYIYSRITLKSDVAAFFISLSTLISGSVIDHFIHLRTEMITCLILYLLMFVLHKSIYKTNRKEKLIYLFFVFILYNFALLNKVQIIIYIPFYIFWFMYFHLNIKKHNELIFYEKKYLILAIFSFLLCLTFFCLKAKGLSIIFYLFYIIILNGLIYFYSKQNGENLCKNIIIFNIFFIVSFIFVFIIVYLLHGYKGQLFSLINSPMKMLIFANNDFKGTFENQLNFQKIIMTFISLILFPFKEILNKLNSESFLFYLNIILLIISSNRDRFNKYKVIICLLFFYLISIISSTRYRTDAYIIFSEFFLIMAIISQISIMKNKSLICFSIFLAMLFINNNQIIDRLFNINNNYSYLCTNSYMSDWHKLLDIDKFKKECKKYVE